MRVAEGLALDVAPGVRVIWDMDIVNRLAPDGLDRPETIWTLEGEPEGFSALRVLTAATGDGRVVLLASLRPAGAGGHGEELVAATLIDDEGPRAIEEALLSTEYAADGSPRRITLELWPDGEDYPLRGAGLAGAVASHPPDAEGVSRRGAALRFHLDGSRGAAVYEITEGL